MLCEYYPQYQVAQQFTISYNQPYTSQWVIPSPTFTVQYSLPSSNLVNSQRSFSSSYMVDPQHPLPPSNMVNSQHPLPPSNLVNSQHSFPSSNLVNPQHPLPPSNLVNPQHSLPPSNFGNPQHPLPPSNFGNLQHPLPPSNMVNSQHPLPPLNLANRQHPLPPSNLVNSQHRLPPSNLVNSQHRLPPSNFGNLQHPLPPSNMVNSQHPSPPSNLMNPQNSLSPSTLIYPQNPLPPSNLVNPQYSFASTNLVSSQHPLSSSNLVYAQYPLPSSDLANPQYSLQSTNLSIPQHSAIDKDPKTISTPELIDLLDYYTNEFKQLHVTDQQKQFNILIAVIPILIGVQKSTLVSSIQNQFFSLLQKPFSDLLRQWHHSSSLSDDETFLLRIMTSLMKKLIKATNDLKLLPSWLSDTIVLEMIADGLTDVATSGKFLDQQNEHQLKYFTRLINAYTFYQERLNNEDNSNKDILIKLLNPIVKCLTSTHFINAFTNIQIDAKNMSIIQKFFLIRCPTFLISYNGSRLEQTMENLLLTMLPQYVTLLNKLVPLANNWKKAIIRSVEYLLNIINHGANQFAINGKLVSSHLSLIDHVLKLVNEPTFYNNLGENSSSAEMILMDTAINFLVNMIKEPSILAHIKQSHMVQVFLRLTSCDYEPLVLNAYTLLAYTTREDDIKAMHNSGRLLSTIVNSLKTTLMEKPNDDTQKEQLLETLKGLIQHEQIKDEIIKQNLLPFLLECTNKLTDKAYVLLLEVLWSLAFHEAGALVLRSNSNFLSKIQALAKDNTDEPLKKAADGLVWKLVREPAFLEKIAKQEAEEKDIAGGSMETTYEEVIDSNGQKQLVPKIGSATDAGGERLFQYDMMISYCHADKDLTYKVHKFLVNQGFKIWIDLNNMHGPAMNAMADAVENSEFVLMCMSDSYKQSTYCQAEAEYAFNCKRRLIPLIIRPGYKADGWLGFMIGSRIYVDFGRFDFETACEKLMTEISLQRKQPLPSKKVQLSTHEIPTETIPKIDQISLSERKKSFVTDDNNILSMYTQRKPLSNFLKKRVIDWTESDVLDFLGTQNLIEMMPLCKMMNGRALISLYKMCVSRSSRIYRVLSEELQAAYKIKLPFGIYVRFINAMEERTHTQPPKLLQTVANVSAIPTPKAPEQYVSYSSKTTVNSDIPIQYPSYEPKIPMISDIPVQYPSYEPKIPAIADDSMQYYSYGSKPPLNDSSLVQYSPYRPRTPIIDGIRFRYPLYPNSGYDFFVISDAPALRVLKAIERYSMNFRNMRSVEA